MSKPIKIVPELIDPSGYEAIDAAVKALEGLKKVTGAFGKQVAGIDTFTKSLDALKLASKDLADQNRSANPFDEKGRTIIIATDATVKGLTKTYRENKTALDGQRKTVELASNTVQGYEKTLKALIANYKAVDLSAEDAKKQQQLFAERILETRQQIEGQSNAIKKVTTTLQAAQGSYNALNAELGSLRKQLRAMPEGMDESSAAAFTMKKRVAELDEQLRKFDRELGQNFREVGGYARGIMEAKAALDRKKAALQEQSQALMVYGRNLQKGSAEHNKLQTELNQTEAELKQVNIQLNAFQQNNNQTTSTINNMGVGLKSLAVGLIGLSVLDTIRQVGVDTFNTGKQFESLRLSIDFASGSAAEGAKNFEFLREISERLGLDLLSSANGFKQILAAGKMAGMEGKEVRRVFESVATAATAMGLSAQDQEGIFLALSQILSKGTVQAEELRGQIGERLPGAFNIAAKALGVTTKELNKMLEQGQVLSKDFLPAFATELQKTFEVALPAASDSVATNSGRMSTAWKQALDNMFQSSNTFINGTIKIFTRFAKGVANIFADPIQIAVNEALSKVSDFEDNMVTSLRSLASKTKTEGGNVDSAIQGSVNNVRTKLTNDLKKAQAELASIEKNIEGRTFVPHTLKTALIDTSARVALLGGELEALKSIAEKVIEESNEGAATQLGTIEELRKKVEELTKARDKDVNLTQAEANAFNIRIKQYNDEIERLTTLQKAKKQVNEADLYARTGKNESGGLADSDFKLEEERLKKVTAYRRKAIIESGLEIKRASEEIDQEIEFNETAHLLQLLELYKRHGKDTTDIEKQLLDKRLAAFKDHEKKKTDTVDNEEAKRLRIKEEKQRLADAAEQAFYEITDNALYARQERQMKSLEANFENELHLAGDNARSKELIEANFERKRAALLTKQAQQDKNKALFDVALSTAIAVAKAVAASPVTFGLPFSAFALANGAIQAAVIASRPIPQYFKGTHFAPEGLALVDEKGPEIIERKGKMYMGSDEGPRLTYLERGDKVYTAEQTRSIMADIEPRLLTDMATESYKTGAKQLRQAEHNKNLYLANLNVNTDPDLLREVKQLRKAWENQPQFHSNITKDGFETLKKQAGNTIRYLDHKFPNGR